MHYWNDRHLNGIRWNGKHSRVDFGATVKERRIDSPEKVRCQEKVPYSSVKYDFTQIFGKPVYNDRTLQYTFTLTDHDWKWLRKRVRDFIAWLYEPMGKLELYDSTDEDYHFLAELVSAVPSYPKALQAQIKVTFEAYPFRIANSHPAFKADPALWPDLDGDGMITAEDSAVILEAVVNLGSGEPSGLTPEQERMADANRDGVIDAYDAALVQEFAAARGAGEYGDSPEQWVEFLNWKENRNPEVI